MSSALDRLSKRSATAPTERVVDIPLDKVRFDPSQPRKAFHTIDGVVAEKDATYIDELAESIKDKGLIQPVVVKELDDGTYVVVVGECRTRAHLKLELPTIRAIVRNTLTDANKLLMYQLAENVQRQNLTDDELALAIRDLMKGSDDLKPMSQTEIAQALGKSEGWVSRFVKFGDQELQRLWVKSGIVDTVEKLYRLSILPKAVQVDVLRRVNLDKSDPDWLEKPILREVIDKLGQKFKIEKAAEKIRAQSGSDAGHDARVAAPAVAARQVPATAVPERQVREYSQSGEAVPVDSAGVGDSTDAVGAAFVADIVSKYDGVPAVARSDAVASPVQSVLSSSNEKYQLPDTARAEILGMVPVAGTAGGPSGRDPVQAPVRCRVSVSNLLALVNTLNAQNELIGQVNDIQCDINIPGYLAQLLANELVGVIVDKKEVASNLQMQLTKLA